MSKIKRVKHICPKCGYNRFITSVVVTQDWEVDEYGDMIEAVSIWEDVVYKPNLDNYWECAKCGAEAVMIEE